METGRGRMAYSFNASEATLEVAKNWLSSCLRSHAWCSQRGYFEQARPKRLLQLSGEPQNPKVLLIEADDLPSRTSLVYLTLSHCWGFKPLFKLTNSNYSTLIAGLPFWNLSQTFRDAIQVTIRLGYQYLWIDALCILQDNDDDKAAEIPRMGIIYGNSVCTTAALSSESGDGGFFVSGIPSAHMGCKLWMKSGATVALGSTRIGAIRDTVHPTDPAKARYAPYLHQRARVVQERALSPRTLYFSRVGIHWECCTSVTSEESWHTHGGHLSSREEPFTTGMLKLGLGKILRAESKVLDSGWHHQWWHLVSIYSGRKLTHTADRWPAISGIASMFELAARTNLVAGIWESWITRDMLWKTKDPTADGGIRARLDHGFPTWSWLSIDGWISIDQSVLDLKDEHYVLRDVRVVVNNSGRPCLVFGAPMLKIPKTEELRRKTTTGEDEYHEGVPISSQLDLLRRELCKGAWRADVPLLSHKDEAQWSLDWMLQHQVWALPCTSSSDSIRMLIVKAHDDVPSAWERIGQFEFDDDAAGEKTALTSIGDRRYVSIY